MISVMLRHAEDGGSRVEPRFGAVGAFNHPLKRTHAMVSRLWAQTRWRST